MADEDRSFWSEWCSERAAALSHAHWNKCDPAKRGHPGTGDIHPWDMCCHCGKDAAGWLAAEQARAEEPVAVAPALAIPNHKFISTMGKACGFLNCGLTEDQHPVYTQDSGCHHEAITPKWMVSDKGMVWTACPICGVMIEPKLATGTTVGPRWGIGQGWSSPRMYSRWAAIKHRFEGDRLTDDDRAVA